MWTTDDIKATVAKHKVVIFAKGTKEQPVCGFSHRAIAVMSQMGKPFEVVNIFDDPSIRPALMDAFGWPTTPQVFVGGELLGGSDIVLEMAQSGELQEKLDAVFAQA
ncbi:MAG: glutaredoxin family protein [Planctomycetota bacterium]|jgi:monothiol glutaredoxin